MRMVKLCVVISLALASMLSVGCTSKMEGGNGTTTGYSPYGPYIPPGTGPGLLPNTSPDQAFTYGGTATLTVTNQAMYNYLGWTPNVLSDVKVNINLTLQSDREDKKDYSGWGGVVTVAFKNDGVAYQDSFSSLVNPNGTVHTNGKNNQYNNWYSGGDAGEYFHGFFQDNYGAIVVVIDDVIDLGDGEGPQSVSGEIWVKNHPLAYAPLSPTSCWYVSLGPYDCRTWKDGHEVNPEKSMYPSTSDGYTRLGRFTDLDVSEAFNDGYSL